MPTERIAQLVLPWPPSINHYWRHAVVGKRAMVYVSKEGKEYRQNVLAAVLEQGLTRFHEDRVTVDILIHPPDRRVFDLDNRLKPTLDALAHAGVYTNDSQIDRVQITRGAVVPSGSLVVTVRSVETADLFAEEGE